MAPQGRLTLDKRTKSRRVGRVKSSARRLPARWFIPILVFTLTAVVFLPSLFNKFLDWDDDDTLVKNLNFRGLGPAQLRWMFTTFHMGHYQPLSWMTLAA